MADEHDTAQIVLEWILAIVCIIIGFILLLWGGKLFNKLVFLIGFIFGTWFIYFLLNNIGIPEDSPFLNYTILVAVVFGLCFGCCALKVVKVALFLFGATIGGILAQCLWHLIVLWVPYTINYGFIYNIILVVALAIIFGFIAIKFGEILVIPAMAFIGSYIITAGIAYIVEFSMSDPDDNVFSINKFIESESNTCDKGCWAFFGVWIFLFIVGVVFQTCCHKNKKQKKQKHKKLPNDDRDDSEDGNQTLVEV